MRGDTPQRGNGEVISRRALTVFTLFSALFLGGCNAAMWGNLAVLALTVGIFFSTLGLGRTHASSSRANGSTSTASRG